MNIATNLEWSAFFFPKRPSALKAFLKSRVSAFKVTKEFRIVDDLPKSPAGKILKRQIRKDVVSVMDFHRLESGYFRLGVGKNLI